MATVIPTDGIPYDVTPANGRIFTLAELQAVVGGYLEALRTPDGRICYLNEEGKLKGLPLNLVATMLLRHQLPAGDHIVGNVILCTLAETGDDDQGDDQGDVEAAEEAEPASTCAAYRPDHNGECLNCDEPISEHTDTAIEAGRRLG